MQTFEIVTQHGKMKVKVEVETDPIFNKLGLESEKIEQAMMAIIHEHFMKVGFSERPPHWGN